MKICHVTVVHDPYDVRIFYKMACSVASLGHDVFLLAPDTGAHMINNVIIIPFNKSNSRFARFLDTRKIPEILSKIHADIYHFHDPEMIPAMLHFKKKHNKIVIYDVHEYYREVIFSKLWIPKVLRKTLSWYTWKTEKMACKCLDCIISATEELSKVYEPYAVRNEFIINYDFRNETVLNNDENKDIDVIHVGTMSRGRLVFMLDIVKELHSRGKILRWCFIGLDKEMMSILNESQYKALSGHVQFVGRIPFEDVMNYYKRSKIGISYHPFEKRFLVAIPMKIFEYMKHGLAVVASDLPPVRKYIKDGVNGYLETANTVVSFANTIEILLKDDKYIYMGKANKELINEKYNWENEAKKLVWIYESLLEKK